jgi:hypothetical protein
VKHQVVSADIRRRLQAQLRHDLNQDGECTERPSSGALWGKTRSIGNAALAALALGLLAGGGSTAVTGPAPAATPVRAVDESPAPGEIDKYLALAGVSEMHLESAGVARARITEAVGRARQYVRVNIARFRECDQRSDRSESNRSLLESAFQPTEPERAVQRRFAALLAGVRQAAISGEGKSGAPGTLPRTFTGSGEAVRAIDPSAMAIPTLGDEYAARGFGMPPTAPPVQWGTGESAIGP